MYTHYNMCTMLSKCSLDDSAVKKCERDSSSMVSASISGKIINSGQVLYMSTLVYQKRIHDVLLWDKVKLA